MKTCECCGASHKRRSRYCITCARTKEARGVSEYRRTKKGAQMRRDVVKRAREKRQILGMDPWERDWDVPHRFPEIEDAIAVDVSIDFMPRGGHDE